MTKSLIPAGRAFPSFGVPRPKPAVTIGCGQTELCSEQRKLKTSEFHTCSSLYFVWWYNNSIQMLSPINKVWYPNIEVWGCIVGTRAKSNRRVATRFAWQVVININKTYLKTWPTHINIEIGWLVVVILTDVGTYIYLVPMSSTICHWPCLSLGH